MTDVHPLRRAYAEAYAEQARDIRAAIEKARDRFPTAQPGADQTFETMAELLDQKVRALLGPDPVDLPHPDEPAKTVRVFADGTVEVL